MEGRGPGPPAVPKLLLEGRHQGGYLAKPHWGGTGEADMVLGLQQAAAPAPAAATARYAGTTRCTWPAIAGPRLS